jgi:hypothetical protein
MSVGLGHGETFATGMAGKVALSSFVVEEFMFKELPDFRGCRFDSCMEGKKAVNNYRVGG